MPPTMYAAGENGLPSTWSPWFVNPYPPALNGSLPHLRKSENVVVKERIVSNAHGMDGVTSEVFSMKTRARRATRSRTRIDRIGFFFVSWEKRRRERDDCQQATTPSRGAEFENGAENVRLEPTTRGSARGAAVGRGERADAIGSGHDRTIRRWCRRRTTRSWCGSRSRLRGGRDVSAARFEGGIGAR
jgi:hypothetical protein